MPKTTKSKTKSNTKRKPNKWLIHVKKTMKMKSMKNKPFKEVLKHASKTYKKK